MSRAIAAVLVCAGALGCTDRSLYGKVGQDPKLPDKLTLTGVLCTDNPATRQFPVKILFIVDSGGAMREAAPSAEHVRAIEQTLSQYLPIANVYLGVVRYDDNAQSLIREQNGRITSGFTRDSASIDTALIELRNGSGARDFASALSLARSIVTGDAFQAERGPLSRTKYVVVHLTTGSPNPPIPQARCQDLFDAPPPICEPAFLEKAVRDLRNEILGLGAAEFAFHTIHLEQPAVEGPPCDPRTPVCNAGLACVQSGARADTGRCVELCDPNAPICVDPLRPICATTTLPNRTTISACSRGELSCFDGVDNDGDGREPDCSDPNYPYGCNGTNCEDDCRSSCRAERIGLAMSLAAGGRYERFAAADQLSMGRIDFRSTQRLFVLKEFLVVNRNAIPTVNGFLADTDGDGLADVDEDILGTNALDPDSDGDGYGDRLEHLLRILGTDPLVPGVQPDCDDPYLDTDGDALGDCEEKLLGTDRTLFDSDADGFPDTVEFRSGTNPLAADVLDDLDLDGVTNGRELLARTDPSANDAQVRAELAYRPRIIDLGPTGDQRNCYDIRISNITLVHTRDRGFGDGNNDIDVYFAQVPDGALDRYGIFRVAQVRVRYLPPDRRVPDTAALDLVEDDFAAFEQ